MCEENNYKMVEFLIKKGANVNSIDQKRNTPLFTCVEKNSFESFSILIENMKQLPMNINDKGYNIIHKIIEEGILSFLVLLGERNLISESILNSQETSSKIQTQFPFWITIFM